MGLPSVSNNKTFPYTYKTTLNCTVACFPNTRLEILMGQFVNPRSGRVLKHVTSRLNIFILIFYVSYSSYPPFSYQINRSFFLFLVLTCFSLLHLALLFWNQVFTCQETRDESTSVKPTNDNGSVAMVLFSRNQHNHTHRHGLSYIHKNIYTWSSKG